ncbi:MAG: aldo/keto reductase [Gaiellales bacterium]|nr:aldo/keto reductase [Gaiellales bacterium]
MGYVNLGRTGVKVSRLALGCGNFGGIGSMPEFFGRGETMEEAFAIMDAAFYLGINLFDTANAYGGGASEHMIGQWLASRGSAVRDQLLISTKVFNPVGPGPNDCGLSRRHLLSQVDISLSRLGVDYLDLFLLHEPDPSTPLEESLSTLNDLVHAGKVRYVGASNMPAWLTAKALWLADTHGWCRIEWIQNSYSLLERKDEVELFPLLADQGLGFTPFSPLAGGWLTGKYQADQPFPPGSRMTLRSDPYQHLLKADVFAGLERLRAFAESRGTDTATLSLAWLLHQPRVTSVIMGPRRPTHLEPGLQALEIELTPSECEEMASFFIAEP